MVIIAATSAIETPERRGISAGVTPSSCTRRTRTLSSHHRTDSDGVKWRV